MRIPFVLRFFLFIILPLFVITCLLVHFTAPKNFESYNQEISYWNKSHQNLPAADAALELLSAGPNLLENHYVFWNQYLKLNPRDRKFIVAKFEDVLGEPKLYYQKKINSTDKNKRNIGVYGFVRLGTLVSSERESTLLFDTILKWPLEFPYMNELLGDLYDEYGSGSPVIFYEKELKLNPQNVRAKRKLFLKSVFSRKSRQVNKWLSDPDIYTDASNFPYIRMFYFKESPGKWFYSVFEHSFLFNDLLVVVMAMVIFFVWLGFLWYMDVFRDIQIGYLVLGGFVFTLSVPLVLLFYDYYYFSSEYEVSAFMWKENLITGLFEEGAKMIFPLLITLMLASKFRSPYAVLILFFMAGLVFAMLENLLYMGSLFNVDITTVRGVFAITIHLCATGLTGYGVVLYLFREKHWTTILLYFAYGVFLHFIYDFVTATPWYLLNYLLVIMSVYLIFSMVNNVLNNSPKFDHNKEAKLNLSGVLIISGLSFIMLLEFVVISFQYSSVAGFDVLRDSLLSYGWLALIFASPVSNFKLVKGKWSFMNLGGMKSFDNYSSVVEEIEVSLINTKSESYKLKILGAVRSDTEKKWFHCVQEATGEYYLVSFKEDGDHLVDANIILFVLRAEKEVKHAFSPKDYAYLGMVHSRPVFKNEVK